QAAVRVAEVPAVSRAWDDSEGSADVEPGAGSADGAGAAAAGVDQGVAEKAVGHRARHAHAGVLARLPEVVLPADGRRRRGADFGDSRLPDDVPRRPEPEAGRGEVGEQQLTLARQKGSTAERQEGKVERQQGSKL